MNNTINSCLITLLAVSTQLSILSQPDSKHVHIENKDPTLPTPYQSVSMVSGTQSIAVSSS